MIIFLDIDGVLANFCSGAFRAHNKVWTPDLPKNWNFYKAWGMTTDEFWAPLENEEFWHNLHYFWWTKVLYEKCTQLCEDVIFSTTPCKSPYCAVGKLKWMKDLIKHEPDPSEYFLGSQKHLLAGQDRILIDDYDCNCEEFENSGGHALLWPQPWNTANYDIREAFKKLEGYFDV